MIIKDGIYYATACFIWLLPNEPKFCEIHPVQMAFSHELRAVLLLQAGHLIPREGSGLESNMERSCPFWGASGHIPLIKSNL